MSLNEVVVKGSSNPRKKIESSVAITTLGSKQIEESLKKRLIAEMRVVRAYSYFKFTGHYGGVPLITKPFGLDDDFKVSKLSARLQIFSENKCYLANMPKIAFSTSS